MILKPIKKTYGGRCVLDIPGLELREGEICALIGSNGSGKSTLARIAAGTLEPDSGSKAFERRSDIGYMPQRSYAFRMSVLGNLRLGGATREKAGEMLEKLGLGHLARSPGKRLSGGETARLALGRVLIGRHELLVLDEPTASMDMESTAICEGLISEYCRVTGAAVLWVTHSLAQARRVADTAAFLHSGLLWEYGPAEKLLNTPSREETRQFLKFYE